MVRKGCAGTRRRQGHLHGGQRCQTIRARELGFERRDRPDIGGSRRCGARRILKRSALRSPAYQCLTFAFAPRSTDRVKSADGNLAFMDSTRLSGFSARLSSSSNTTRYLSVKSTAVLASRGAPTLLCPGITTEGSSALILLSVFNHSPLAPLSVSAV